MIEKKIVKTMDDLWLIFLVLMIVSIPVKGALGWWMWGISFALALGTRVVKSIFQRRANKKSREHWEELLNQKGERL